MLPGERIFKSQADYIDGACFAFSALIVIGYHMWYYSWRFSKLVEGQGYHRVDISGQSARTIFCRAVIMDHAGPTEANLAIQIVRNSITASSLLATGTTVGATTLVNILLDDSKMAAIRALNDMDPFTRSSTLFSPEFKVVCAIIAMFLAFFSLAQSLRLAVHYGFFVRAASYVREHPDNFSEQSQEGFFRDSLRTCLKSQTHFSVGLRCMYLFVPLVIWMCGGTYLLVTTMVVVLAMFQIDQI